MNADRAVCVHDWQGDFDGCAAWCAKCRAQVGGRHLDSEYGWLAVLRERDALRAALALPAPVEPKCDLCGGLRYHGTARVKGEAMPCPNAAPVEPRQEAVACNHPSRTIVEWCGRSALVCDVCDHLEWEYHAARGIGSRRTKDPMAWAVQNGYGVVVALRIERGAAEHDAEENGATLNPPYRVVPLYAHPPTSPRDEATVKEMARVIIALNSDEARGFAECWLHHSRTDTAEDALRRLARIVVLSRLAPRDEEASALLKEAREEIDDLKCMVRRDNHPNDIGTHDAYVKDANAILARIDAHLRAKEDAR